MAKKSQNKSVNFNRFGSISDAPVFCELNLKRMLWDRDGPDDWFQKREHPLMLDCPHVDRNNGFFSAFDCYKMDKMVRSVSKVRFPRNSEWVFWFFFCSASTEITSDQCAQEIYLFSHFPSIFVKWRECACKCCRFPSQFRPFSFLIIYFPTCIRVFVSVSLAIHSWNEKICVFFYIYFRSYFIYTFESRKKNETWNEN